MEEEREGAGKHFRTKRFQKDVTTNCRTETMIGFWKNEFTKHFEDN